MPRTRGARGRRTLEARIEFDKAMRRIKREHGEDVNPLAVLAELCRPREESSIRVQAAGRLATLMYPTLKSIEVNAEGEPMDTEGAKAGQLVLAWDADEDEAAA